MEQGPGNRVKKSSVKRGSSTFRRASQLGKLLTGWRKRPSSVPAQSRELSTLEVFDSLIRLALAVCLSDPSETIDMVKALPAPEEAALARLSRHVLNVLSSVSNICLTGLAGNTMQSVEGIAKAFELPLDLDELAPGPTRTERTEQTENTDYQSEGSNSPPARCQRPSVTSDIDACRFNSEGDVNQNIYLKSTSSQSMSSDVKEPPPPATSLSSGRSKMAARLVERLWTGDSVSSSGVLKTLLRRRADASTAQAVGEVHWSADGTPVDPHAQQMAQQGEALIRRYDMKGRERAQGGLSSPGSPRTSNIFTPTITDLPNVWDAVVPPASLLMFLFRCRDASGRRGSVAGQGVPILRPGQRQNRVLTDGECSVSTAVMLDHVMYGGRLHDTFEDIIRPMNDSSVRTDTFPNNVRTDTFPEELEVLEEKVDEEEMDPQARYAARKARLRERKKNAAKSGKVTYGELLRQNNSSNNNTSTNNGNSLGTTAEQPAATTSQLSRPVNNNIISNSSNTHNNSSSSSSSNIPSSVTQTTVTTVTPITPIHQTQQQHHTTEKHSTMASTEAAEDALVSEVESALEGWHIPPELPPGQTQAHVNTSTSLDDSVVPFAMVTGSSLPSNSDSAISSSATRNDELSGSPSITSNSSGAGTAESAHERWLRRKQEKQERKKARNLSALSRLNYSSVSIPGIVETSFTPLDPISLHRSLTNDVIPTGNWASSRDDPLITPLPLQQLAAGEGTRRSWTLTTELEDF